MWRALGHIVANFRRQQRPPSCNDMHFNAQRAPAALWLLIMLAAMLVATAHPHQRRHTEQPAAALLAPGLVDASAATAPTRTSGMLARRALGESGFQTAAPTTTETAQPDHNSMVNFPPTFIIFGPIVVIIISTSIIACIRYIPYISWRCFRPVVTKTDDTVQVGYIADDFELAANVERPASTPQEQSGDMAQMDQPSALQMQPSTSPSLASISSSLGRNARFSSSSTAMLRPAESSAHRHNTPSSGLARLLGLPWPPDPQETSSAAPTASAGPSSAGRYDIDSIVSPAPPTVPHLMLTAPPDSADPPTDNRQPTSMLLTTPSDLAADATRSPVMPIERPHSMLGSYAASSSESLSPSMIQIRPQSFVSIDVHTVEGRRNRITTPILRHSQNPQQPPSHPSGISTLFGHSSSPPLQFAQSAATITVGSPPSYDIALYDARRGQYQT